MKKLVLVMLWLSAIPLSWSQSISKIDFDAVKKEVQDSSSEYYYSKLFKKMLHVDSTLSSQEYKHLYYGNVYQKYYQPYGISNLKKSLTEQYKLKDYDKVLEIGKTVLEENPVDLEVLLKMSIASLKLGNEDEKHFYANHYYSLLDVIYNSGDGREMNSAYVVISVDHEYQILGDLGLRAIEQHLITDCDLLKFRRTDQEKVKGRKKVKALYFNVRMPLMSLSTTYKDADLPDPDEED
ncbi:MAG: hypothetical protein ACI857_000995 [Arenicella sp.]|jgi:hypothetical protein